VREILLAGLLLGVAGCGNQRPLLFHAGVGQRSSLNEIKALYEAQSPKAKVHFSYKGSGYFLADITRSREGDLYLPGEEFYLLQAAARGFIKDYDPKTDVAAQFATVILTPRDNPANVRKVSDFARPGLRVGIDESHSLRGRESDLLKPRLRCRAGEGGQGRLLPGRRIDRGRHALAGPGREGREGRDDTRH